MAIRGDPLEIAARALRHRDRSARDVDERLARAGVGAADRAAALETLERVGYVDDRRFAGTRAGNLAARGHGDASIRNDLERQGVAAEAADAAIAALEPERDRAAAIVARGGPAPRIARRLAARGFADDAIAAAVAHVAAEGIEPV